MTFAGVEDDDIRWADFVMSKVDDIANLCNVKRLKLRPYRKVFPRAFVKIALDILSALADKM